MFADREVERAKKEFLERHEKYMAAKEDYLRFMRKHSGVLIRHAVLEGDCERGRGAFASSRTRLDDIASYAITVKGAQEASKVFVGWYSLHSIVLEGLGTVESYNWTIRFDNQFGTESSEPVWLSQLSAVVSGNLIYDVLSSGKKRDNLTKDSVLRLMGVDVENDPYYEGHSPTMERVGKDWKVLGTIAQIQRLWDSPYCLVNLTKQNVRLRNGVEITVEPDRICGKVNSDLAGLE